MTRRLLQSYAAQSVLLDALQGETFSITFRTSIRQLVLKNLTPGKIYVFILRQDSAGNHTIAWGSSVTNAMMLDPNPNAVTVQAFMAVNGSQLAALSPGTWNE